MNCVLGYTRELCSKTYSNVLRYASLLIFLLAIPAVCFAQSADDPVFDLRDYFGDGMTDYTTAVRSQSWGTCWIHGTYGAMESNLSMTGNWTAVGMTGEADLAEYHLDKFNGFNRKGEPDDEPNDSWYTGQKDPFPGSNYDEPLESRTHGLIVHLGGDYRIATAYLTNYGTVNETDVTRVSGSYPDKRIDFGYGDYDGIPKTDDDYHYFIPCDVEWHTLYGADTEKRQRIKQAVVDYGAVATCMYWGGGFYSGGTHYQPPADSREPNHAIAIIGWDDSKQTQAGQDGAWLCRNSWGSGWNGDGHFWISYYDKHTARHPEMGGVTFRGVRETTFDHIYSHSLHGWQYDTSADMTNITQAANRFVALKDEQLVSVGIYSLVEDVSYTVSIYDILGNEETLLEQKSGTIQRAGFHLIDLDSVVDMYEGEDYFIVVELDHGGYAFDASFRVYTAMGIMADIQPEPDAYEDFYKFDQSSESYFAMGTITDPPYDIYSKANSSESFYKNASGDWLDFFNYDAYNILQTEWNDKSWNFAITGYSVVVVYPCEGDFDNDGNVDGSDLAVFAADFGRTDCASGPLCEGDFDGDNDVDGSDLAVFAADFGRTDWPR